VSGPRRVIIEADGGSRGNPGPAAYGALLKDADTGELLAEDGTTIGPASNNVAEYRGLIAGLELAREFAPEADIEVRMDSKLVVEQMSGRWKIKHPDMVPLASRAHALAPFGTTYTWVPREQNKHADRLANEALDGLLKARHKTLNTVIVMQVDDDARNDERLTTVEPVLAPEQVEHALVRLPSSRGQILVEPERQPRSVDPRTRPLERQVVAERERERRGRRALDRRPAHRALHDRVHVEMRDAGLGEAGRMSASRPASRPVSSEMIGW